VVYLTQIIIARWMGASELGVYIYAYSWCVLFGIVATAGMPMAANRYVAPAHAAGDHGRVLGYVRRGRQLTLGTGVAFAVVAAGYMWVHDEISPSAMTIGFLVVPLMAIITLHQDVARAHLWHILSSVSGVLSRPLLLLLAVLAGWALDLPPHAWLAMLFLLVCAAVVASVQFVLVQRRLRDAHERARPTFQTRTWLRTASVVLLIELFVNYLPEISIVVVGAQLPADEVAIFSAALRTVSIISFGIAAVTTIVAPHIAHLYALRDMAALQRLVTRATTMMFLPSIACLGILIVLGDDALDLFGDHFHTGYTPMIVLGAVQLVTSAIGPVMTLVVVSGNYTRCLPAFACAILACVILNTLVVPYYGVMGAAAVYCAVTLGWTMALRVLVVRHIGVEPSLVSLVTTPP
jgi:O-antigen/teichoic acid export membrane protein